MSGREDWRILYEIICCAEWKEVGVGNSAKRSLIQSNPQFGPDWLYALSPNLHYLAILQDSTLEIRSAKDNFSSSVGKNSQAPGVVKDSYPWLRLLTWSPDSSLLCVAFTNGLLNFFDTTGSHLFSLRTQGEDIGGPPPFSPSSALNSIFFIPERIIAAPSLKCAKELVSITGRGILKCYRQPSGGEGATFTFHHEMSFRRYYPRGIHQVQYIPTHSILIVTGVLLLNTCTNEKDKEHEKYHGFGLTCWRILHDHPYYRIIHTVRDPQNNIGKPTLGLWHIALSWTKQYSGHGNNYSQDEIYKLRLSPDGLKIAGIHCSGSISIWHIPSLKLQNFWPLFVQFQHDTENPYFNQRWRVNFNNNSNQPIDPYRFHPFDINWWGIDKLIITRVNGCVTLISLDGETPDKNLLGDSPELFESPLNITPRGENHGFYTLDCEIRQGKDDDGEFIGGANNKKWRLKTLITDSLFWLMDIEKFRPVPKKRSGILSSTLAGTVRTYRFFCLQSITPTELFHRKIDAEEYGDAIDLAKLYDLDLDLVYQRQWTKTPVSLHSIRDYLGKIKKRNWVLQECLERVPDTIEATRELLEFGLKGTDLTPAVMISQGRDKGRFIVWSRDDLDISESEYISLIDPENEEVCRLIRYRHQFLHFLDMLNTYELMLGGSFRAEENFDPIVFNRLRSRSPWESGMNMAKDCDISGLRTLLTHHWSNIGSNYLIIISNFPETISPHDYRDFLPSIEENSKVILWNDIAHKDIDWSHDYLEKESNEIEITCSTIETWYDQRIRQIESRTGLVNCALDLGRLGLERDVENLKKLVEDLETLEVLVYQVGLDHITLGMLEALSHIDRVELLMSKSCDETFVSHMKYLVLPFLSKCEERIPESRLTLLNQYLTSLAIKDLHLVLKVFEASKLEETHPLISSTEELMALAYNAIYACENPKENENILGILGCIPDRGYGHDPESKLETLHDSIDELELHYSIGQMLGKYDIWLTLTEIEGLTDKDDLYIEEFILNICHSAIRMVPPLKLNEWKTLLYDLLELKKKILHKFPTEKCFELYVNTLLQSGIENVIYLAKDFIGDKDVGGDSSTNIEKYSSSFSIYLYHIPRDKITNMILNASQIYFDSSSSYNDLDMNHSKITLSLLSSSSTKDKDNININSKIQILLDLIDGIKLINKDFNMNILPQTVRKTTNYFILIRTAMKNIKKGYKKIQQLLKLSILLRINKKMKYNIHHHNNNNCGGGGGGSGEEIIEDDDDDDGDDVGDDNIKNIKSDEIESIIMEMCGEEGMEQGDIPWVIQLCHTIIVKNYNVGWKLFYQLAKLGYENEIESETIYLDNETRIGFINYALTLCPQDQIISLLKTKYLIEIRTLQNRLKELSPSDSAIDSATLEAQSEDDGTIMDDILHKTRIQGFLKTTTSWINPLRDLAGGAGDLVSWTKSNNHWNKNSSSSSTFSTSEIIEIGTGNANFEKEGYPAFRLGSDHPKNNTNNIFHTSQLCYNYDSFSSSTSTLLPKGTPSPALELCLILYRIWHLECLILGWEQVEPQDSDVLSCLICDILPEDLSWGIALLLSIEDKSICLKILSTLPPTPLLNLIHLYYLSLLIKKHIDGVNSIGQNNICYQNPNQLISQIKIICEEEMVNNSRNKDSTTTSQEDKDDLIFLMNQFQECIGRK